ncbi:peptidase M16 [Spirochaetia bacterium]|nr:peptidase M16 [Spirochaetia bacterium]
MKTNLQKGVILDSGFKILDVVQLDELKAAGIYARHEKSGAEVFHVLNDDSENLFAFAFATAPEDSTGIAHIIEHSVLCGSENYPLKETFNVLAQGSLHTFLNAWTFPDKTVYPASSLNEKDYFNLMAVYGDAVFRPRLDEWTFMQEGYRYEFKDNSEKLTITGVVYNEMKGAYSALDEYAGQWSIRSVLPDTIYAHDSGGDPERIPDLTFEKFKQFHKERYSPANCKIYLEGNIPTEKQFAFLNEKFLNNIEKGMTALPVKCAERWNEGREYKLKAPAGSDEKVIAFISWLCSDYENGNNLPMSILTEILLGHDGSPLTKALIESGLGEDLAPVCGLESEMRQAVWTVGLRGVENSKQSKAVESLIINELKRLVREGIPKEEIEAALLLLKFSHKEIKRAGGPWSLVSMRRCLRGWLNGFLPWDTLLFSPRIEAIKKEIANDSRYFEKIIQKEFLDNPHRALVILESDKKFLSAKEKEQKKKILSFESSLSIEKKDSIRKKNEELLKRQNTPDSPEALKTIPHLTTHDLATDIEKIDRQIVNTAGISCVTHNIFTNNIVYCDFAFPVDFLSTEEYLWLPLFTHCANSVGLPGMNYAEVSSLFARTVGDFTAMLETGAKIPQQNNAAESIIPVSSDYVIFRLKTLDQKLKPSLELACKMIREADFTDTRRLNDLILECKNDAASSLAPNGSMYAALSANKGNSRSRAVNEIWKGLTQLEFIHKISKIKTADISERLIKLRDKIISNSKVIINITGENNDETLREIGSIFSGFSTVNSNNSQTSINNIKPAFEVYSSHSLQIGFSGVSMGASAYTTKESAAEKVLCHYLSTGALWTTMRMQGGAYGASVHVDPVEKDLLFSTYRDPDPIKSLSLLPDIFKNVSQEKIDHDMLEKTIIGTYSTERQPRAPGIKGLLDFLRFIYNIKDEQRLTQIENIISVKAEDVAQAALRFYEGIKNAPGAVIAGKSLAAAASKKTGVKIHRLPV